MTLRLAPVAEHALLVEFGDTIHDATSERIAALDRALAAAPPAGLREVVPGMVNLLVDFDPLVTDHAAIEAAVRDCLGRPAPASAAGTRREVEVCYDPDLGTDLSAVAGQTGLSVDEVIAAHLGGDYRVRMYGFTPGYAYMSGTPAAIRLPRKPAAVRGVPAGSVIIAGPQCIVTTLLMPTGWWVLGRSPTRILTGDEDRPFLFDVGDPVGMRRIGRDEFERKARRAVAA
ncbi:5-oxoprolinase subunit B family protein [Paracoccus aeridis]|uniref:5-oxoprolinase subunit B family protein n=1 Tax=Paracoccus aeridis TaxID=1966466 RepID=UPI00191C1403|nr:allophanate hydrolase subunit 1 [Paracoccus aeridis]